jgi:hypothetical protein
MCNDVDDYLNDLQFANNARQLDDNSGQFINLLHDSTTSNEQLQSITTDALCHGI